MAVLLEAPEPAQAALPSSIPSAFAAYGHYLALLLTTAVLVAERLLIRPGMTEDDFDTAVTADAVYGVAGLLTVFTGYLQVTQYGKGWEFYSHEPIFWLKMTLLSVMTD